MYTVHSFHNQFGYIMDGLYFLTSLRRREKRKRVKKQILVLAMR